jgi:hypothetical protein
MHGGSTDYAGWIVAGVAIVGLVVSAARSLLRQQSVRKQRDLAERTLVTRLSEAVFGEDKTRENRNPDPGLIVKVASMDDKLDQLLRRP